MESMSPANSSRLAIPSTQNTAPVHCFRCLYTYDLRRKAKRWQDGTVRFHTFNKRIMVYDTSRNFIGDTHWQDGGVIEDGDELKLDAGALIQVGEKMKSVNQDLTSLWDKRGKKTTSSAENDKRMAVAVKDTSFGRQPCLSSPSQLRPKPLNAILGSSSGSRGRAIAPLKSPYEIQMQSKDDAGMQRGAKRRRIDSSSKTMLSSIRMQGSIGVSRTSNSERSSASGTVKVTSEWDLAQLQNSSPSVRTANKLQPTKPTEIATTSPTSIDSTVKECVGDETTRTVPCPKRTHSPIPKVLENPTGRDILINGEKTQDLQENNALPRKQLQIISRKPRKKLIYQDSLPSIAPTDVLLREAGKENSSSSSIISSKKSSKPTDLQFDFHQAQKARLESSLRRYSRGENDPFPQDGILTSIDISDDDEDGILPPNRIPRYQQHHRKAPGILPLEGRLPEKVNLQPDARHRTQQDLAAAIVPKHTTTITSSPSISDDEPARMDQILLRRSTPPL